MQTGSTTGVFDAAVSTDGTGADDGQAAFWNGLGGQAWVDNQDLLDRMFGPLAARLAAAAASAPMIDIQPLDIACCLPESGLERYFTRLGPLGRVLHLIDAATRARIVEIVRPAFDPYADGDEVRFDAACWQVTARAADGAGGGAGR